MKHLRLMIFLLVAPGLAFAGPLASMPKSPDAIVQPAPEQSRDITVLADRLRYLANGATLYDAACCKVCNAGKACGDSCISRSYTCRKGRGCACDG